jgi:hypothetical protein
MLEFYPKNDNLLGLNYNRGQQVLSIDTIVARTRMNTYAARVWDLSIVQGPFSVVPNPNSRFATFSSCEQQGLRTR